MQAYIYVVSVETDRSINNHKQQKSTAQNRKLSICSRDKLIHIVLHIEYTS